MRTFYKTFETKLEASRYAAVHGLSYAYHAYTGKGGFWYAA